MDNKGTILALSLTVFPVTSPAHPPLSFNATGDTMPVAAFPATSGPAQVALTRKKKPKECIKSLRLDAKTKKWCLCDKTLLAASELKDWCEHTSKIYLSAKNRRPRHWVTKRVLRKGNTHHVQGRWRTDPDSEWMAVECQVDRGGKAKQAKMIISEEKGTDKAYYPGIISSCLKCKRP